MSKPRLSTLYSEDDIIKILRQRNLENCFIGGSCDPELAIKQGQFFEGAVKAKDKFAILPLNLGEHLVLCFFIFDNEEKTFQMLYFDPSSNEERRGVDIARIIGSAVLPSGFAIREVLDISTPIQIANCGLILIETAEIIIGYFRGKVLAQYTSDDCDVIKAKIRERFSSEANIGVIRFGHEVALSELSAAAKRKGRYKAFAARDGVGASVDDLASKSDKDIAAAALLEMSPPAAEIAKYSDDKAVPMLYNEDEVVAEELLKIKDAYAAEVLMSFGAVSIDGLSKEGHRRGMVEEEGYQKRLLQAYQQQLELYQKQLELEFQKALNSYDNIARIEQAEAERVNAEHDEAMKAIEREAKRRQKLKKIEEVPSRPPEESLKKIHLSISPICESDLFYKNIKKHLSEIEESTISKGLIIPIRSSEGELSEFIIIRNVDEKLGTRCLFFYLNPADNPAETFDLIKGKLTEICNQISEYQTSKGKKFNPKETPIISFQALFQTPGVRLGETFSKIFKLLGKFYHEYCHDLDKIFFEKMGALQTAIDNFIKQGADCELGKKGELVRDIVGKYGKVLESVEYRRVLEMKDWDKEKLKDLKEKLRARNLESDLPDAQIAKRMKGDISDSNTEASAAQPAAVDAAEAAVEPPAADAEKPTVLPLMPHAAGRGWH